MKNYEITEEQIKELAKGNAKVEKMFPEVFKNKLEVGKWYKNPSCGDAIFRITKIIGENTYAYGFNYEGEWRDDKEFGKNKGNEILATNSEVLEVLTNEFKKRNQNSIFNYFRFKDNILLGWNLGEIAYELFKDGVFTKFHTKEEAEKLLNAKII